MVVNQKFLKSLGQHINKLRIEKGLSYSELADLAGVDKSDLHALTTKGKNITVTTLHKLSKGLDVHIKDLLDF